MNPSTSTRFTLLQNLLFNRSIYLIRLASFLPNDVIEASSLHEEIPGNEPKHVHEMVGRKRLTRVVYGSGLCSTGALAIEKLLTPPVLKQCLFQPMRIIRMNTRKIRFISAGCGFSLFASNNELYGSGLNNFYQISGPKRRDEDERPNLESGYAGRNEAEMWYIHGRRIVLPEDMGNIRCMSAGRMHSVVLTDSNKIFCFGSNSHGQCGADPLDHPVVTHDNQHELKEMDVSTILEGDVEIVKVHASLDTSFALCSNGKLFAWGLGTDGQLGNGNDQFQWKPSLVRGDLEGERIVEIGGSTDTLVAVNEDGHLFIWGQNEYGQMCSITDEPQIFLPQQAPFKLGKIVGAEATGVSCIVCNSDGQVFTWGSHVLGFGPKVEKLTKPMQIDPPLFTSAMNEKNWVVKVFAGGSCMGALTEAGHLFTWGSNKHGVLALSHRNHQYFPFQVSFAESIKDASFGPHHSLFLTNKAFLTKKMKQTTDNSEANKLHKNIFCDGCHKEIRGRRYKCLVCTDFDLCHLCEQKNEHFGHAMLRLVTPKTLLPDFVKAQFEDHHFTKQKASTSQQGTLNQKKSVVKPKKKKSPKKIPPRKIIQKKITTRKITLPTTTRMRIGKRSNIKEEPVSDVLEV